MTTVFREPSVKTETSEAQPKDNTNVELQIEDYKPLDSEQDVLTALGVADDIRILPQEDKEDLQELKGYLQSYLEEQGLPRTIKASQKALQTLKKDFGLDEEADPQAVIRRIGSVAKSYRSLSFIKDLDERKSILIKLATARSLKEMDRIVFEEMERKKVWLQ